MMKLSVPAIELFRDWISKEPRKQGEIAMEIGVSEAVLSRWKNGHQAPIHMARVAIENITKGAVPRHLPWNDPETRKDGK